MKLRNALLMGMTAAMLSTAFTGYTVMADDAVEVEYWCLFGGADGETMTKMVDAFNTEYEGKIHVNCVTQDWDNYYTKIKTAIMGGEAPDLCNSHDEYVNGLIKDGYIVPIDDPAAALGIEFDYDNYIEKINQLKSDDHVYAIPIDCLQLLLDYHKDMIAEAGLADENGNLVLEDGIEGFLKAVDQLNNTLDVPGFAINPSGSIPMYLFNSLYYQCGGEGTFVNEEGTEFIADKDIAVKAMDIFQQIGQASLQNVENISDLFIQKKVAMVIEGAWQMNYLRKNSDDYGVQSLPLLGDTYKTLTSISKANALNYSMVYWDQIFNEVSQEYPEIETHSYLVDAASMFMVKDPKRFQIVVTSNLFGDILTDLGAAISGGMGLAAGANLNPERKYPSMFEPIHGSAPDIAGKGIANPCATFWSVSQMLDFFGQDKWAKIVLDVMEEMLVDKKVLTPDLGGSASTSDVGDEIIARIMRL